MIFMLVRVLQLLRSAQEMYMAGLRTITALW
jgi:hypothetical protein